jgi:hypothetical protein
MTGLSGCDEAKPGWVGILLVMFATQLPMTLFRRLKAMVYSVFGRGLGKPICLFLLWAGLVTALLVGCEQRANRNVPPYLIGVWKTEHPRYQGLFLEITDLSVTFNTVEGGLETYWICRIESSDKGNTAAHVIYGQRYGEKLSFQFYYESTNGGRLHFKNQLEMSWSKVADDQE